VPLRVLFVPFGSEGDVNPLAWLADGMAARGHEPIFVITPHYAPLIEERGYPWIPVGTKEDFDRFARDPRVWSRLQGTQMVIKGMTKTLPAYRQTLEKVGDDLDLVVLSTLALGAASVAEAANIPRITLHMQPALFRSTSECPVFMEELAWLRRAPNWTKRLFFALVDMLFWNTARRQLNTFRREIGLPRLRNFYDDALHGAEGVAALFPAWFAAAQPDWPPGVRQFGFPVAHTSRPLSDSLEDFLTSGEPPVLWTHGSANFDLQHFQSWALAVSRELNLRCLLISLDAPASVSGNALHVAHARFEDLFPRCKAIVHHGGIGTTAKCIAAGVPQLIIPRSHDQPDNAHRVVKLNLGKALSYHQTNTRQLTATLRQLLGSEAISARCREFKQRMLKTDTLSDVCDWAEQIAANQARTRKPLPAG
jgi:rhamnosyltransferase subunit B